MPAEALFYHLEHQPLDRVLPLLVEKSLERGWRAVIQAGTPERVSALDTLLWTYRDDSFVPHGTKADGRPERQPVFLTETDATPNGAQIRFLVDGAAPADYATHQRYVFLFDGADSEAVAHARSRWKDAKAAGCTVTYWQQNPDGRWEKKA